MRNEDMTRLQLIRKAKRADALDAALLTARAALVGSLGHTRSCDYNQAFADAGDFCTCNLDKRRAAIAVIDAVREVCKDAK